MEKILKGYKMKNIKGKIKQLSGAILKWFLQRIAYFLYGFFVGVIYLTTESRLIGIIMGLVLLALLVGYDFKLYGAK